MSHVLLGGDEQKVAALRLLLTKWGVTTGQLMFAGASPTIQECDAAILVGQPDKYRDACLGSLPDGSGGAAGPAAPLVFICGEDRAPCGLPAAWLLLQQVDADGSNLREALLAAFAEARARRGLPTAAQAGLRPDEADSYLHFLGHELRSPLTAIKTALEVLEGELGGLGDNSAGAVPGLKMLNIALRNVRRLHRTVDWSQDLLAASEVVETFTSREVAMTELAARLQPLGEVRLDEAVCEADLQTDPEVLMTVVAQMARVVGMAAPDSPVLVRVGPNTSDSTQCQLMVVGADGGHDLSALSPERFRLVVPVTEADSAGELERLARFMVAPDLVAVLGASLSTVKTGTAGPALVLNLALVRETLAV